MSTEQDPSFTVVLPLLGRELRDEIISYSLDSSFTSTTDAFTFTIAAEDPATIRSLELQPVELQINDRLQLLGRIDRTRVGGQGTAIDCSGRDYLADLVECHVDPALKLKKDMALVDAILNATGAAGIRAVVANGDVGLRNIRTGVSIGGGPAPADFKTAKVADYKPNPSEGLFAFINMKGAAAGVILHSKEEKTTAGKKLELQLSLDFPQDFAGSPSDLIHEGRVRPTDGLKPGAALYRLLYRRDPDSKNQAQLEKALQRAMAERLRPTLTYECTVQGHTLPGTATILAADTIVEIEDAVCDVFEPLWVESVHHAYADGQGATTRLTCRRLGSYLYLERNEMTRAALLHRLVYWAGWLSLEQLRGLVGQVRRQVEEQTSARGSVEPRAALGETPLRSPGPPPGHLDPSEGTSPVRVHDLTRR